MMLPIALTAAAFGLLVLPTAKGRCRVRTLAGVGPQERLRRQPAESSDVDGLVLAASWDLLAACLRTGLPVADAIRAVAVGMAEPARTALLRTGELIALGADPDEAWQPVLDCEATVSLGRAARRTARSGTALVATVTELAEKERAQTRERAEARAERAGVLVTAPLGLCFLPAFLCLGVVPVVIGLASGLTIMP